MRHRIVTRALLWGILAAALLAVTLATRHTLPTSLPSAGRSLVPAAPSPVDRIRAHEAVSHKSFGIIDKKQARLDVYDGAGNLSSSTPVLIGHASGDVAPIGIGMRPVQDILPHEKITPAGRYEIEFGKNLRGEQVLWLDYDAGLSMHPVLRTENRMQRLLSPGADDNRVSAGCINMPDAAHAALLKLFDAQAGGVVYILPDDQDAGSWLTAQGIP